jgi:glycosyltransferase involved in cell wall biosynthesis
MNSIDIYHNILWSKYKGVVFSAIDQVATSRKLEVSFYQIAETEVSRASLSAVNVSYHDYYHTLLFKGSYEHIPKFQLCRKLFTYVWISGADLIILPGYHRLEYWVMLLACLLKGVKPAVFCDSTINDNPQNYIKGILKRLFFSFCDGFFVYGKRSMDYVIHYGGSPDKVFIRCQAAALPPNYLMETIPRQRMLLSKNIEKPRFLYVGRLSVEKSITILLKSFAKVRQILTEATLVIIGDGPQRNELYQLAQGLELGDSVFFTGSMDSEDLGLEYLKASCLVLPSFSEPWGLVVNEALSYGCPVVVSHRCGCVPELVENTLTGFVFEAENVDDLASKLLSVPTAFGNVEATAHECLKTICKYTPQNAAESILLGCESILSRK